MKSFIFTLLGMAMLLSHVCQGQYISLSLPIDHSVVQRNNSGVTQVWVTGQFLSIPSLFTNAQYEVLTLDTKTGAVTGTAQTWTGFGFDQYGLFRFSISLPAGWYQVSLRATVNGSTPSASVRVGVGDVFYIAGQSNAQGVTNTSTVNEVMYDGVVADQSYENCSVRMPRFPYMQPIQQNYGIGTQGPNSWCYGVLGNYLVNNTGGIPVAFFNGAQGGTFIQNWLDAANNQATYYWFAGSRNVCAPENPSPIENAYYVGQPYRAFKNLLNLQGGLFGARGVIWHQGEADNQQGTTTSEYESRLNTLVNRFRGEVGNYSMPCWIAKATYDESRKNRSDAKNNPPHSYSTWDPVSVAQANQGIVLPNRVGPDTDQIANTDNGSSTDTRPDGVHFSGEQLRTLGENWASNITNNLIITTPTLARIPPPIQITNNGFNQYTANVVNLSGDYFWTPAISDAIRLEPNQPTGSSQLLSNGQPYRCYVKTLQGTYAISQIVRAPSGSPRLGTLTEETDPLSLKVFPNPTTQNISISFTLNQPSAVRLELIDVNGQTIRIIADNFHSKGSFQYPIDLTQLPIGVFFCRLKADDLFVTRKFLKN